MTCRLFFDVWRYSFEIVWLLFKRGYNSRAVIASARTVPILACFSENCLFFSYLSFSFFLASFKARDENNDCNDDGGYNGRRGRDYDVVQLFTGSNTFSTNFTTKLIRDVARCDIDFFK